MANNKTANDLAKEQREISISQFFVKNKHLLGFDNPRKALSTTIKELVDNALDACQEINVLPEIKVEINQISDIRYIVTVEDNGPGIVKEQIPKIFGKLLYGSKFFKMAQSLTEDEPIIIQRKNKIEILPIGNFVNHYLNKNQELKEINNLNIKVPAFDKKTYSYKFRKVSHLIKHKRQNEILKITTATNRVIKVTGCHSLFSEENGNVKEVEARNLNVGDKIIAPYKIPETKIINEINILDYINLEDIKENWFYVYNIPSKILKEIKNKAKITYKKTSERRKFYRINNIDILEDSFKQYESKKFLPLHLVLKLKLKNKLKDCIIKTYFHGKETIIPVTLPLSKEFIRFLGFFVAEGHSDTRQIGLTFGRHEDNLVKEIINFARTFGLNFTVENRDSTIRIKLFGNIFVKFIKNICGKRAENKKIPEFIFRINKSLRQEFLDSLYLGDGHNTKGRNQLILNTISKKLANEIMYLWLMQGILSSVQKRISKGLGKNPSLCYAINLYGKDIETSNHFTCNVPTYSKRVAQQILKTDLSLLKIKNIEIINKGYEYVYDLSVPECENFVGGFGGISCHNSRGQQGIGVSASVLYGQLTTGKPTIITSKIARNKPAHHYELHIDTKKNEPEVAKDMIVDWDKEKGTKVKIELEGSFQKGKQGVDEYLKQTAIVNPHLRLLYKSPEKELIEFPRVTKELPIDPKEIKPHPYGLELGTLIQMLKETKSPNLQSFLKNDFCRVSSKVAKEICEKANLYEKSRSKRIAREEAENLFKAIKETKIIAPPTNCLSPIGEELILKGLKKEINAEFYTAITRPPNVYRGFPFQVECGICYGGDLEKDNLIRLLRFANRVPLQYQQSACAITKSILATSWRNYNLSQSKGALPAGPVLILVHIASVWVPFTSESKEAIAHYPEIIKEIKLALQEAGRKLGIYIRKKAKAHQESQKKSYIEKYLPHIGIGLKEILDLKEKDEKMVLEILKDTLERSRS
ncbi:MAG: DNA topoisomerase VI subunit B [Nanoarchaeota archaeon]|nr:DNA topoisomerase VI subunit B [Nanoarchaeota archaeon]